MTDSVAGRTEKKKTDAQKRYLAKKARKHRVLAKAKRDAAPKNKQWTGANSEAGPSDHEDALREEPEDTEPEDTEPAGDSEVPKPDQPTIPANGDPDDDSPEARLERKRLKREKRENRDRSDRKVKRQRQSPDDPPDQSTNDEAVPLSDPPISPLLSAFPLPAAPTPADPALLTKQGLPKGLEHAQIVDPSSSAPLDDLPANLQAKLKANGIEQLFAVQAAILPRLFTLPLVPNPYTRLCDYLASAPTGSGKTLAYALPIVHILSSRVVTRLRALIVLPTRDLVQQVRETLEVFAKGTGLKIGTVAGQHSFTHEQNMLDKDILIATPGRLIDHLNATEGFLRHLRFLIIDEADRLLGQSYHDWLARVLASTTPACQKLLFSATLTRDPAAIASLHLQNPQYLIVQSSTETSFALPEQLAEHYVVTLASLKPLVLIHLLTTGALVFTKSVDSATRLVQLLSAYGRVVRAYTSDMKASERKSVLAEFSEGRVEALICSDLVARGMDLPMVSHVISYDVPLDMPKYVHRVGRTARAGRPGTAWTLVEKQEALHFKSMLKSEGRSAKRLRLQEGDLEAYRSDYEVSTWDSGLMPDRPDQAKSVVPCMIFVMVRPEILSRVEQRMLTYTDGPAHSLLIVIMQHQDSVEALIHRVLLEQPRYIGMYAPGDFHSTTFRIILPNPKSPGRGYHGMREEVVIERNDRRVVEEILSALHILVNTESGPRAIRHIRNPSSGKDEGIRLVWAKDGELGDAEIADWPRRDALIRQGKTVRGADEWPLAQGGIGGMWPLMISDVPME